MCVWHCVWEGRAGTWSLWDLLFPAFAGLLDPHKPRCWPKSKIWKLFCKSFWCPWPIACLLRSKRHCCLDEQRVCFRPETSESKSLIFIEHYLVIFPVIPDNSMYCVWCFFFEMRCVQFLNLTTTFGDLPASLGFEWRLCPVLLFFKFTFIMFLFSPPLAHWGLRFGSLNFAA